ncbi:hypothetical protein Msil_1482 [Methylocella silvestris BL2]|uniref:Uncharacterized protein n=1 Tax=Methylocella silvestris (strain DSM 15510 / CIP 108128 / LMG 27833 / NCIMB 13906 / BL2) TaxID=395965 RepID=B8ESV5_METSB|nr:hypothetical protein Msil_1482 [Methylocella silvestris BL2]
MALCGSAPETEGRWSRSFQLRKLRKRDGFRLSTRLLSLYETHTGMRYEAAHVLWDGLKRSGNTAAGVSRRDCEIAWNAAGDRFLVYGASNMLSPTSRPATPNIATSSSATRACIRRFLATTSSSLRTLNHRFIPNCVQFASATISIRSVRLPSRSTEAHFSHSTFEGQERQSPARNREALFNPRSGGAERI